MAANRGSDTGPERLLRNTLGKLGVKGCRTNFRVGKVRPDLVFPARKVAIFVHGCFWHHCPVCNLPLPRTHARYWEQKFLRNRERDRLVREGLESGGWRVVEVWEHEVRGDALKVARRVERTVRSTGPQII
jgi:DNA mismatch endonuclease, patch repair protein